MIVIQWNCRSFSLQIVTKRPLGWQFESKMISGDISLWNHHITWIGQFDGAERILRRKIIKMDFDIEIHTKLTVWKWFWGNCGIGYRRMTFENLIFQRVEWNELRVIELIRMNSIENIWDANPAEWFNLCLWKIRFGWNSVWDDCDRWLNSGDRFLDRCCV
jgi:hypothetical protein